ncbi:MAG: cytochrome c [Rhodocyclaceae bacterium]|nr:cytochrome c [Rhodocyclaceae bacterium]
MKKTTKTLLAGFALSVVAGTTLAQMKVEDAITFRQSGYKFMAWNMGKIKANVEGQYNKDQVAAAANVVAAIANSGMGALFIPGSDKGKGWHETNVKPELFTDKEGVGKVARAYIDAANEMARVAATGDAAAVKAQFGKLGETCKACHDKYRKEEH